MLNKLIIVFVFIANVLMAQQQFCINVIDEEKNSIPGAIIKCKTGAGITDNKGEYCFYSTNLNDTIEIRYLGYNSLTLTLKDVQRLKNIIVLSKKINEIDSIKISENVALYYIQKVIIKITDNYNSNAFIQQVDYVQYHKENDKYVRFIQCISEVIQNKYKSDDIKFSRRFKHIAIRKSVNYEENKETHSDHFYELFGHNPVWDNGASFLNMSSTPFFNYTVKSINDSDITIDYCERQYNQDYLSKGFCIIDKASWAVKYIEESKIINKDCPKKREYTSEGLNWKFQNQKKSLRFKKSANNWWFCSFISFTYNHHLYKSNFSDKMYSLEETFVMQLSQPTYLDNIDLTNFNKSSNLYLSNETPEFKEWNKYDFLNSKLCPSKLKSDLIK